MTPVEHSIETLKELLQTEIKGLRELVAVQHRANEEALKVAATALEGWKSSQNEFRAQSKDKDDTFATREQVDRLDRALGDRVNKLEKRENTNDGKYGMLGSVISFIVAVAALVVAWQRTKP